MAVERWFPALPSKLTADVAPKKRSRRGYDGKRHHSEEAVLAKGGLSDDQVLDVRGMHQFQGMTYVQLGIHFKRDPNYIGQLCRYMSRRHLEPLSQNYPRGMKGRKP